MSSPFEDPFQAFRFGRHFAIDFLKAKGVMLQMDVGIGQAGNYCAASQILGLGIAPKIQAQIVVSQGHNPPPSIASAEAVGPVLSRV